FLDEQGIPYNVTHDFHGALREADAVYAGRVKNERRAGQRPLPPPFVLGAKVYHALPRAGEIDPVVDGTPVAGYMQQAIGAVGVRVALLRDAKAAKQLFHERSVLETVAA